MYIKYFLVNKQMIFYKDIGEKRIITYAYFATKQGLDNTVGFSCDDIVNWAGYKHDYHKNCTDEKFATTIKMLANDNYFVLVGDISRNNFVQAKLNIDRFYPDNQFALIYVEELNRIRNFKKYTTDIVKMNSSILLLVLSYIRVNMLRRHYDFFGEKSDKPEFCYKMFKDISDDIGLSSRYISRAVKILEELDIIATFTLPRRKDESGNWHTEVTLFANKHKYKDNGELDEIYDYKQELSWGQDYINQKKYLKKKFNQEV